MGKKRLAAFLDVVLFKICVGAKNHVFSRAFFLHFCDDGLSKKNSKVYAREINVVYILLFSHSNFYADEKHWCLVLGFFGIFSLKLALNFYVFFYEDDLKGFWGIVFQ